MAVIRCPYCKKYISSLVSACPECGMALVQEEPELTQNNDEGNNIESEETKSDTTESSFLTDVNKSNDATANDESTAGSDSCDDTRIMPTPADSSNASKITEPPTEETTLDSSAENKNSISPADETNVDENTNAPLDENDSQTSSTEATLAVEASSVDEETLAAEATMAAEASSATEATMAAEAKSSIEKTSAIDAAKTSVAATIAEKATHAVSATHAEKAPAVAATHAENAIPTATPTLSGENTKDNFENIKVKKPWWKPTPRKILVLLFFVVVISGIVFFIVADKKREEGLEQRAYERLASCTNLLWYEDYILRFPEGKHITEVKQMYDKAKKEQDDFFMNAAMGSKEELQKFIDEHPASPYIRTCQNRIDSLDWDVAVTTNTKESYQAYLQEHPDGIFADVANENKTTLVKLEVTNEERSMLRGSLDTFLSAMTSCDESRINATTSDNLVFCGQTGADGSNVINFYSYNFHQEDVMGVHFNVNGGINITKKPSVTKQGSYDYSINANLDVTLNRSSVDSVGTQRWKINAQLTPDRKFKSIELRQQ